MQESLDLTSKKLCDIARSIFGEGTDFDEAYQLAEQHAEALRECIYDSSFLNQRHTTPLHIAAQEISDPEKNEIFLLFYDKNEPWVLLQLNEEGLSALDILCRQGNEWLIRFLLPDTYNFDIDGLTDEDIEDMDDDDITLYDILNLRFKHHVKHEDGDEENNEFGLQYTLTHNPQSHPLAECLRSKNTHVFKLLIAANFPLETEGLVSDIETSEDVKDLTNYINKIDSRIKALEIHCENDLLTNLLYYPEETEALVLLQSCNLFITLSRKSVEKNKLHELCHLLAFCIPNLLARKEDGENFIFEFLAFIETKTEGDSTELYQNILKTLLIDHETPQINAVIFIIDAFVACRKLDWSTDWTENKADEIHDAYVDDITNEEDLDPKHHGRPQTPDSDDDDYLHGGQPPKTQYVYPLEAQLIIEKRCNINNIKEDCLKLWSDDLLKMTLDKPHIVKKILLARGAVFPEEMLTSETFPCPTLCRVTICLGDLNLEHFISLVDTLSDTELENLCKDMSAPQLKEYVDQLFDLKREFTRGEEKLTLETLAKEDPNYLLNITVTSRLRESVLPYLFKFIKSNERARLFFNVNHNLGIQYIDDSEENVIFHHFFSIFLSKDPACFFGSLITEESPETLIALTQLMLKSPSDNVSQQMIKNMVTPKRCKPLFRAVITRILNDGELNPYTTQLLEFILQKPASKAWHAIENDKNLSPLTEDSNDMDLALKLYTILTDRKILARTRLMLWYTEWRFRQTMQLHDANISRRIVQLTFIAEAKDKIPPDLSKIPARPK
ncbi:MAG: hypothetical protein SFW07_07670 [Gammaproteobacteria bacterium]|nr:hypothetical protein [Gammaproteobacteria bacterium]